MGTFLSDFGVPVGVNTSVYNNSKINNTVISVIDLGKSENTDNIFSDFKNLTEVQKSATNNNNTEILALDLTKLLIDDVFNKTIFNAEILKTNKTTNISKIAASNTDLRIDNKTMIDTPIQNSSTVKPNIEIMHNILNKINTNMSNHSQLVHNTKIQDNENTKVNTTNDNKYNLNKNEESVMKSNGINEVQFDLKNFSDVVNGFKNSGEIKFYNFTFNIGNLLQDEVDLPGPSNIDINEKFLDNFKMLFDSSMENQTDAVPPTFSFNFSNIPNINSSLFGNQTLQNNNQIISYANILENFGLPNVSGFPIGKEIITKTTFTTSIENVLIPNVNANNSKISSEMPYTPIKFDDYLLDYYQDDNDNSTDYPIVDYVELYKDTTNEKVDYVPTERQLTNQILENNNDKSTTHYQIFTDEDFDNIVPDASVFHEINTTKTEVRSLIIISTILYDAKILIL